MLFLRARYYNSAYGRFQSRDIWSGDIREPSSLNKFSYVRGNVTNDVDPSGLCSQKGWSDASGLFTKENCDALENDLEDGTTEFTAGWYQQLADRMRADGLTNTADAMEYYLQGSGGERSLSSSFVKNTIEVAMPEIQDDIDDLTKWYIKKNIAGLVDCDSLEIGPDIYAKGYTANYFAIGLGRLDRQQEVAGTLGSFRIDVELSGKLNKKPFLWSYNADSQLSVHVVMLDVYNWNKGSGVYYPARITSGNWIKDDWAANLEKNGTAKSYINRGDYSYTDTQNGVWGPGWFFDSNNPPSGWLLASCIGSQFDKDQEGPGTVDYCGNPMR